MRVAFAAGLALALGACASNTPGLRGDALDLEVERRMEAAHVPGLALAVIELGEITHLKAYGKRDVARDLPLTIDTVMYAASITKTLFAYSVMTLVDDGRIELDRPIAAMLPKPLPDYPKYADLANDERWRRITPRMLLDHTAGFPNFRFWTRDGRFDENGKLTIEFDPGTRYAYSGEGINLLQFAIENGPGIDIGTLIRERVFDRFGMRSSSMIWREDFAANLAIGYDEAGRPLGHKQRGSVRAAGSLDTTIGDYAKFLAGLVRCEGLTKRSCEEMRRAQIRIESVQQFPTLSDATTRDNDAIALAAGLGIVVYQTPQGAAFFKSGHDDGTNNLAICLVASERCVLVLSNSSNGESTFTHLIEATLGPACFPWYWENYIPYDAPALRDPAERTKPHPPCAPPG
jgi:CubicO group peptidase (beta-lactamase class C family)